MDEEGGRLGRGVGRRQPINQALLAQQLCPGPLPLNIASEGCTAYTGHNTLTEPTECQYQDYAREFSPGGMLLDYLAKLLS